MPRANSIAPACAARNCAAWILYAAVAAARSAELAKFTRPLVWECLPSAPRCPVSTVKLSTVGAEIPPEGQLFLTEFSSHDLPCMAVGEEASRVRTDPSVAAQWPLPPGHYALCYCEMGFGQNGGCPKPGGVLMVLRHVGELRILGAVRSVVVQGPVGVATVPLDVAIATDTLGIRCCATFAGAAVPALRASEGPARVCDELSSARGAVLPAGLLVPFRLVLHRPRVAALEAYNVSCGALVEEGACQGPDAPCGIPVGGIVVNFLPVPPAWDRGPWWVQVGSRIADVSALAADIAVATAADAAVPFDGLMLKAVTAGSGMIDSLCDKAAAIGVVQGWPCQGAACVDRALAVAMVPGSYSVCVCEPIAAMPSGVCLGWHRLGDLGIFGPRPFERPVQWTLGAALRLRISGVGFSAFDIVYSIPVANSSQCATVSPMDPPDSAAAIMVYKSRLVSSSLLDAEFMFSKAGKHLLCWAQPIRGTGGATPSNTTGVLVGIVTVSDAEVTCVVGPWTVASSCEVEARGGGCSFGWQPWYRDVEVPPSPKGGPCPALEEARLCWQEATCEVERLLKWKATPAEPSMWDSFTVALTSTNLPKALFCFLVPRPFSDESSRLEADQCSTGPTTNATLAACNGTNRSQLCSFTAMPVGVYDVCVCWAGKGTGIAPACRVVLPAIGILRIGVPDCPECQDQDSSRTLR